MDTNVPSISRIHELISQLTSGKGLSPEPNGEALSPAICAVDGATVRLPDDKSLLNALHNEPGTGRGAANYPLRVEEGLFFSEVFGVGNADADRYRRWIGGSLKLIRDAIQGREGLPFDWIDQVGRQIQELDQSIAGTLIGKKPDTLHALHGIDPSHPYRKLTLCRTRVPVLLPRKAGGVDVRHFLYEKFLVSYSYMDQGRRRSTRTPIHSHPWNHEVVYFLSAGANAYVEEEEFHVHDDSGAPLVSPEGEISPNLLASDGSLLLAKISLRCTDSSRLGVLPVPKILEHFTVDLPLRSAELIANTDGFFRPHRVTVHDDPNAETLYYAINNYWGPTGRVFVYGENGTLSTWSHRAWSGT
jgi:hypothetical protein